MDTANSEDDKPSIIQEIVFYNKPNIKAVVPGSILLESPGGSQGQVNIAISHVAKEPVPVLGKESPFKTPKGPVRKGEKKPQKISQKLNVEAGSSKWKEEEESIQKIPKRTSRSSEKLERSQQKATVAERECIETLESTSSSPKKIDTVPKRPRGRPRKYSGGENRQSGPEGYNSEEESSFKSPTNKKKYTELTSVPLDNSRDLNLQELLDDAEEHTRALDRVEEDLQNMFTGRQGEENQQTMKGKQKTVKRKAKVPVMLVKKVKTEVEDVEGEEERASEKDTSIVEEYDTEDSRGEWVPVEYAEYRQQHSLRHQGKMFTCKFCGLQFSSYYGVRKHRALEHNDLGRDRKEGSFKESPANCKMEKEQDESDEESRDEWMPQDYADYKMKHKMNKMKRIQWYKCKICCAVFSNYYKLSKHKVEHQNIPNPYECKQCNERFKDVETLMAHIRVHQGKDPYQCRKCDKGFANKEELDEHVPVHILKKGPTPPKRFRCDICSKEFAKLCDIERHTRVHTGEKPSECNICHKRFQQSHNLSKHLLTHLHVKPFQCEICNKKFGRIDVLNRHLLTHSMEKPCKCQICGKGFIRQIQLSNHVEKMHTKSDHDPEVADDAAEDDEFEEDAKGVAAAV